MTLKAIIFDMDGVLVDSIPITVESHTDFFKKHGMHLEKGDERNTMGMDLRGKFSYWKKKHKNFPKSVTVKRFSEVTGKDEIKKLRKEKYNNSNYKSLRKLIQDAKKEGIRVGVGTSSRRWRAEEILKIVGIKKIIEEITSAEEVRKAKPDPHIYLKAAKKFKVEAENCLVFEDADNGVIAAKKAGMKCIAIKSKYETYAALKESKADKIIKSFEDINLEKIKKMFKK